MKKAGILFILLILLILNVFSVIVNAQDDMPGTGDVERIQNFSEKLTNEERRAYLAQEWQKILLENKVVSALDSLFKKIDIVFRVLFAMPYSLSLTLLCIVILWIIIFIKGAQIIRNALWMNSGLSYIMGFALAVILAQIKVLYAVVTFLTQFIFYQENAWVRFIVVILIVGVFLLFYYLSDSLSKYFKEQRKKAKEGETEAEIKNAKAFRKGVERGIDMDK